MIQKFGLTEERAEEEREKIEKKLLRSAGMHAELKKSTSARYGVSEARLWPGMGCL